MAERVSEVARERYGLESLIGRLGLPAGASETVAREARYRFLRQLQEERGARWLVTAHHADDQAETVLLRVLRGSAPAGLAGIPAHGQGGLIRPMLGFSRDEILTHVGERGLEPFIDPANADLRHDRSWVRHVVMPVLRARKATEATEALLSVARHARREKRAWDAALSMLSGVELRLENGGFSVARAILRDYDKALAGQVLRAAGRRAGLRLGPRAAQRVVDFGATAKSGRRLDAGGGLIAEIAFDRLQLYRQTPAPGPWPLAPLEGTARFGTFEIAWRPDTAPERLEREAWTTWIAPEALTVRAPNPGDRLVPLRGTGHREVTRLLMEARVARGERGAWPVLVSGDEPVWLPGICRSDAALPAPGHAAVRVDVTTG